MKHIYFLCIIFVYSTNYLFGSEIEYFVNEQNTLQVKNGKDVIFQSSTDSWIFKDSLIYEMNMDDKQVTITETNCFKSQKVNFRFNHNIIRTRNDYYCSGGICDIIFDISSINGHGLVFIPSDSGFGLYSFILGDSSSFKLVEYAPQTDPEQVIATSQYGIWLEFREILHVNSFLSDSSRSIGSLDNPLQCCTLNRALALNGDSLLLMYDKQLKIFDLTSFIVKSTCEPARGADFSLIKNSLLNNNIWLYNQLPENPHKMCSSYIYRYSMNENKILTELTLKDCYISFASIDQKGMMHVYYLSEAYTGSGEQDEWIYHHDIYETSTMKMLNTYKQSQPFEYFRLW